ncbi:hypothetical protein GCM10018781_78820 [Kitasatospora indigofera]|uniref:Uncharacterized protein n=1 Tax=Kitasatospora indigofera TaxID=67307 RepID=A0A919D826_9ACTN|nr:hypothetical protein [Kitasatospora indigofera]GHE26564.1 hypothetical protein GCM10018781_78820 [Kitasatospora indigofera]
MGDELSDEERRRAEYRWASPRLNEDMQMSVVPGGPVNYTYRTEKAVEYVTVANDDGLVLGYLWACDADDAAGWQARPAARPDASNAGVDWTLRLRDYKARDLPPSQALAELAEHPVGGLSGRVVPGSRARASGLVELRELAGDRPPPPPRPVVRGGY